MSYLEKECVWDRGRSIRDW